MICSGQRLALAIWQRFKSVYQLLDFNRNKNIFNLTDLLNFNISVGRIGRSRLRRRNNKCGVEHNHEKGAAKPEADILKCVADGENGEIASWLGRKKFSEVGKNNFSQPGTTYANMAQAKTSRNQKNYQAQLPRMNNNMDESEPATDFQDIIYIMQEFRKLFGKFNDAKTFAQ
ncbi:hypothetical protein AVEN_83546-1 [Araneus ventricosus]|uniref:Uncharacterized protein n=1 Tax=Araneus ventricosus TaxID=182803 RepID=A0A4Y2H3E0_ARAVE|nr:hypothetical protein AVEN_83546-1 [Araneus ventricosus]